MEFARPAHDTALAKIAQQHVARVISMKTMVWWAHEAPADPLQAAAAFDAASQVWEDDLKRLSRSALGQCDHNPEALRALLKRLAPPPAPTPALGRAWRLNLRTADGLPDLTEAEWEEVQRVRHLATQRAREAALARARASLPVDGRAEERRAAARKHTSRLQEQVQHTFHAVFGLSLPQHVFDFHAFWLGLNGDERALLKWPIGVTPGLLFDFFAERPMPSDGTDMRWHGRFTASPPELVHTLWGAGAHAHWGLWFDSDDAEPLLVYAEAPGQQPLVGAVRSLLSVVVERARAAKQWVASDPSLPADKIAQLHVRLDHLAHLALDHDPHAGQCFPLSGRTPTCDGLGAVLPGPCLRPSIEEVQAAILREDPVVAVWVAEARRALESHDPGPALLLGRDLHWFGSLDRPDHLAWSAELMAGAHDLLGNTALAAIARTHSGSSRFRETIRTVEVGSEAR
jgi:hypothetical protein